MAPVNPSSKFQWFCWNQFDILGVGFSTDSLKCQHTRSSIIGLFLKLLPKYSLKAMQRWRSWEMDGFDWHCTSKSRQFSYSKLTSIKAQDGSGSIVGNMQLYSAEKQQSQVWRLQWCHCRNTDKHARVLKDMQQRSPNSCVRERKPVCWL